MDKWLKTVKGNQSRPTSSETSGAAVQPVAGASCSSSKLDNNNKTAEASKKRKYDESYLSFGFTWTGNKEEPNGLCVECGTFLSNGSLFPAKLKRHLETEHYQLKNKNINYFRNKSQELKERRTIFKSLSVKIVKMPLLLLIKLVFG